MKKLAQLVLVMVLATIGYTAQAQSNIDGVLLSSLTANEVLEETQITASMHSEGKRVSIQVNAPEDKIYNVKIKNAAGIPHQSYTSKAGKKELEMDLRILPKGKYLIAITTKNKRFITYEFSKR